MARRKPVGDGTRWLTREQESAWRSLAMTCYKLPEALEFQLQRDAGLSFIEYHALARLSEEPDRRRRMSELAAEINSSLSRLSHLMKRLESRGLVRREPDPTDGRYTMALLTEAGYEKLVASAPAQAACVLELVIDEFSGAELAQLRSLCDRIVARIDASEWRPDPS